MAKTEKYELLPAFEDREKEKRFRAAKDTIITFEARDRHGIGMQKEKTLHAVLKCTEEPDPDRQEIPIGSYIADILTEDQRIIEIQTANMNAMRDKLASFLPLYPVKIVYPIPYRKWVTWIDPETGELTVRNKSTRKGSFYQAFRELYKIRPFLTDPHLSIDLLLLDMEEYRLQDGWSRDKKRGSFSSGALRFQNLCFLRRHKGGYVLHHPSYADRAGGGGEDWQKGQVLPLQGKRG